MNLWGRCLLGITVIAVIGCQQSGTSSSSSGGSTSSEGTTASGAGTTASSGGGASASEVSLPGGLKYQELKVGDGALAESGKNVSVHYTGWLTDGTKFDSSLDRGQPFQFKIGEGGVIQGWDKGVLGMRVGGKRKLVIPSELGYGARGAGGVIPPNATLVFDVELLGVQ
jgi:FKBP-type peptidyl-prolyl cis-trans isomerase